MGRLQNVRKLNAEVGNAITNRAKQKLKHASTDPRVMALIVIELIIVFIVSVGIVVYLDPETNLIPFPWNLLGFAIIIIISAYLYRFTGLYRVEEKQRKQLKINP
ncbi:MAG: hypothetical protein Q7S21_07255 [archaeon]|nr:hypothetical protein [archaeon]